MRSSRRLFLVALATLILFPLVASARGLAPVRIRMALEETDRRIELAETVVSTSQDDQARSELAQARDLQVQARAAAAAGRPLLAGQLTIQARSRADHAITLVRGLPAPDRVLTQLERTRGMLDRAGGRIEKCGDGRAGAMLRIALEMQGRAESAERERRHLGALQLTLGARDRCLRALRLCRIEENVQEAAEQALSQTERVLARARPARAPDATGRGGRPMERDALARAAALQAAASREFRDGHFEASLQLTLSARRLAHRAMGRGPRGF